MDDWDDTAGDIQQSAVLRLHLRHQVAARPGQCSVATQLYSYRFIYVRSSLQENIQRVLKRNSFTISFLALGVFFSIFNVAGGLGLILKNKLPWSMFFSVFIFEQKDRTGIDRIDFVLYRACLDPFADWNSSIVGNQVMMPFYFILVYGMNIVNIASNFYLYFYLEDQRKNNTGPGKVFY